MYDKLACSSFIYIYWQEDTRPLHQKKDHLLQQKQQPEHHYVLVPTSHPHMVMWWGSDIICTGNESVSQKRNPQVRRLWDKWSCWDIFPFSSLERERFIILECKQMSLGRKANVPGMSLVTCIFKSLLMIILLYLLGHSLLKLALHSEGLGHAGMQEIYGELPPNGN